jgi:DNA-binding Lrp family transcriptional regulator
LVNVESGFEDHVLEKIKKIEGVEEAYISYGVYDLVTKIRANTMDDLKKIITHRLRQITNVRSTLTLILVKE